MCPVAIGFRLPALLATFLVAGAPLALGGCEEWGEEEDDGEEDDELECASHDLDWGRGGEYMLPGTDCVECHRPRASASDSVFSVAGTVFASESCPTAIEGAVVHVTDSRGRTAELHSNSVGNFSTDTRLEPPFLFAVEYEGEVAEMKYAVDSGSCNRCHAAGSQLGFVAIDD